MDAGLRPGLGGVRGWRIGQDENPDDAGAALFAFRNEPFRSNLAKNGSLRPMIEIDARLVEDLIAEQFPEWSSLPVSAVASSGWDNRSFRLGDAYVVRLPSAARYAGQVEKEQTWLPVLAQYLPVSIPRPAARGVPGCGYPFAWSVYTWLPGETAAIATITYRIAFAQQLAGFIHALHRINPSGAPVPGGGTFHRGGPIRFYDAEAREAIGRLDPGWNRSALLAIWEEGAFTTWNRPSLWVHGDLSPGNLLVEKGRLSAVIDFGLICAGDPACDFAIAWSFFDTDERGAFLDVLKPDDTAWMRGRCWALWKAALLASGLSQSNAYEMAAAANTLNRILKDS